MSRFVIIDGNAIIHRAYHAIPPLTTKDGKMVNAVYGFAAMLLRVWNDLKPTHLAVSFDVAGGNFRHVKYEKYKATRVKADQELYDQIPLVHELVSVFNIPIFEMKGYEADDVIGTIVNLAKKEVDEVFIVTGDMDAVQLVDEKVRVYTMRKGINDTVIYTPDEVVKRYSFGPEKLVDYKALRGDTSDNIPGIPGIGEKTAQELIAKVGGIGEIYKNVDRLKELGIRDSVIKKIVEGKASAYMSFELATIDCNVPGLNFNTKDCLIHEYDREKILTLFQKFEFVSLMKRLPGEKTIIGESKPKVKRSKLKDIKVVEDLSDDGGLLEIIKKEKLFACKAIVSLPDVFGDGVLGLIIVVAEKCYWLSKKLITKNIFSNPEVVVVGHDLKQLIKILRVNKIEVENKLFDVMIGSYLLNPGSRAHDMASVLLKVLGEETAVGAGQNNLFGIDKLAIGNDLQKLILVAEKLKVELDKTEDLGLMEKVEMPLIKVLAEMELNGIAVDVDMLKGLAIKGQSEIKSVSQKIYDLAGVEFNIASPLQLREVLFERLDISVEGIKKGKTGLSTSAEQLEKMRDLHPIIGLIENFRELSKLQNTYIDVLPTLINKRTGRIHTTFNQAVTATGRLSSSDPNLQNIPIRTDLGREIRRAFVAEKGNILVSADYSQIELRIVASLAEDKKMIEIFERGEDIHKATAAAIHNVPLNEVTKEMRYAAKEVNFGVLYGMGAYGLSWRAGIPVWQAKEFIEKYFSQFSGVKKYIDQTLVFTKKEGYCETLFGRRRYIPELQSHNHQLQATGERMAVNHPIQGTAADLIKMAMIEVEKKFKNNEDAKMILQVHDELVMEVKLGEEEKVGEVLKETMENVIKLRVPILVAVHNNQSWGNIK
ncbi:MAG: DNA polymerase I [bacterium]|nr:DNA polymerase I [bacterium]